MPGNIKRILVFIVLLAIISGCASSPYDMKTLDNFANCLAERGVVEYGAFWCPNCAKQEKMFGVSFSIIKEKVYVECDPRCDVEDINELPKACRGKIGQTENCLQKNVDKYPTWDFPNGKRLVGVQDFGVLARESGCELNV